MRYFPAPIPIILASVTCLLLLARVSANDTPRPNIVLIMTDNHGAWTLGCYGNPDIRTPNIDRLAAEGTLFTRAFASNPVCSPTRATFLTGLVPSQHGVHSFLSGGGLQVGPRARCTLDEFTSLPEVLCDAGYACGLVGEVAPRRQPSSPRGIRRLLDYDATRWNKHVLQRADYREWCHPQGAEILDRSVDPARGEVHRQADEK